MNIIVKKVYNQIMIAKIFMAVNGMTGINKTMGTKINGTIGIKVNWMTGTKINETRIRKI